MNKSFNSKKFLEKKKRAKKIKIWFFVIFAGFLIFGFFYWMRQPSLNVEKISVVKNNFSKAENVEASVHSVLSGNSLFLIPKTNALLLPREEAEEKIKEQFPEIEKIDIDLKGFKEIEVEVFEYEPKIILKEKDGLSYFVNKEGVVFIEEPFLHSYDDLLSLEIEADSFLGEKIIDPDFLKKINSFKDELKEININLIGLKETESGVYRLYSDIGFEIVISVSDDLDLAYENIETIFKNGALKKEDLNLVDYIDLRFGNKVFYKLK